MDITCVLRESFPVVTLPSGKVPSMYMAGNCSSESLINFSYSLAEGITLSWQEAFRISWLERYDHGIQVEAQSNPLAIAYGRCRLPVSRRLPRGNRY